MIPSTKHHLHCRGEVIIRASEVHQNHVSFQWCSYIFIKCHCIETIRPPSSFRNLIYIYIYTIIYILYNINYLIFVLTGELIGQWQGGVDGLTCWDATCFNTLRETLLTCSKKLVDHWRRLPRFGSKQMLSEHVMDIVSSFSFAFFVDCW